MTTAFRLEDMKQGNTRVGEGKVDVRRQQHFGSQTNLLSGERREREPRLPLHKTWGRDVLT